MPTTASTDSAPNHLILQHIPLVENIASAVRRTLPEHIRVDELTSAGLAALVDCARRYEPRRGTTFAQYARTRIRGAMVDEVRSADWASRGVRSDQRRMNNAANALAAQLGRSATNAELAEAMGVTVVGLHELRRRIEQALPVSLHLITGSGVDPRSSLASPEESMVRRERIGILRDAIAELPDNLREVVDRFFYRNERMADIGQALGLSESRVSQMCHEALRMLRVGMERQETDAFDVTPAKGRRKTRKELRLDAYAAAIATRSSLAQRLSGANAVGVGAGVLSDRCVAA